MNPTHIIRREVGAYLGVAFSLASAIAVALPDDSINMLLSVLVPVVTVVTVTLTITPRGMRRDLWRSAGLGRAGLSIWPSAIAIPVVLCTGAYGTAIVVGAGRLDVVPGGVTDILEWAITLAVNAVLGTVVILGEEIGWRGFLLPRLQQLTGDRKRAALATGFIHGCFHLPLILLATTYDNETPRWVAAPVAVALITAGGVFYAWVWDRGGSVWPVAIAHNTVNTVFAMGATAVVTTGGANVAYVAGETGVATLAFCVVLAAVLWRYAQVWRRPLPQAESSLEPVPAA